MAHPARSTTQQIEKRTSPAMVVRAKPERIRVELNIERWPAIWQPAKSKNKSQLRVLEREMRLDDGSTVVSRVEISFNHLGTLTTEEQKMFYALIKQWEDAGRPDTQVFFSDRHLAKILGKGWGTNVIESITKSLRKLRSVSLEWINSYYDKTADGKVLRQRRPFTILGDLKIMERAENGAVNKALGYFRFDDHILRNLLANYTKPFLLQEFFKIKTDIGLLIYNHVDLMLANRSRYERCTRELFEDLGLKNADYAHMHKRKRAIDSPLKELVGLRISTGIITGAVVEKTADKRDYKIIITKSSIKNEPDEAEVPQLDVRAPTTPKVVINHYQRPMDASKLKARELVRYFYRTFHGVEQDDIPDKAVDQATVLIATHGEEKSRYIVDFAKVAAADTNFVVQHFGGILNYTARAAADFDRLQHDRSRMAERQQREEALLQREQQRRHKGERRLAALTPEQYQTRFEQAKKDLMEKYPHMARFLNNREGTALHDGAIRARMIERLENEEMGLLVITEISM